MPEHGSDLRGAERASRSSIDHGRFGRLFRWLDPAEFSEGALLALARTMVHQEFDERRKNGKALDDAITEAEEEDENPTIHAGYTYLGQFIDHDITFDPVSALTGLLDPDALHNFRTPRLDLDSVYGLGPILQPYLYDADGLRLLLGANVSFDGKHRPDLLRNGATPSRALIGDPRNDENLIVSQLHVAFAQLHNAMVKKAIDDKTPSKRVFAEAQRLTRWHYQWVVLHDYLPKVVGDAMTQSVLGGGVPSFQIYRPKSSAYMPLEFSVAAFRFGHSMVRPSYGLNAERSSAVGTKEKFNRIPIFSSDDAAKNPLANLNGRRALPAKSAVDWSFFFEGLTPPSGRSKWQIPQKSYRLDTVLVDPLASLPEFAGGPPDLAMLAYRNLLRGARLGLPSGQAVAKYLGVTPLDDGVLFAKRGKFNGLNRDAVFNAHRAEFTGQAPLWFYVLKEAELTKRAGKPDTFAGHHLGAVGGRIVAEVLVGLVWHDPTSYLRADRHWKPQPSPFGAAALLKTAGAA